MQASSKNYLILSVFALFVSACATEPKTTKFDGDWEFYQTTPFEEPKACLSKEDVKKLREVLIRCQSKGD
jgi:hypothetical protein